MNEMNEPNSLDIEPANPDLPEAIDEIIPQLIDVETEVAASAVPPTEIKQEIYDWNHPKTIDETDVALPTNLTRRQALERNMRDLEATENHERFDDEAHANRVMVHYNGYQMGVKNDMMTAAVAGEKGKDWVQNITGDNGKAIGAMKPNFSNGTIVPADGRNAVAQMRALTSMGGKITIPLWHSGFWATFSSPDEESILAFWNRIVSEKISLGRRITGAALANETALTAESVLEFAMQHLENTSLVSGKDGFLANLKALDIQHVAWGFACAIYQSGFDFVRLVIDEDSDEERVQQGRINLTKLQWTYRPALSAWQIQHMSSPRHKASPETLAKYHEEWNGRMNKTIVLDDGTYTLDLELPNAISYIEAGHHWVDGIVDMVDESFTVAAGKDSRDVQITQLSKATQMRQYDHWVKAVRVPYNDGQDVVEYVRDDKFTIEQLMGAISGNDKARGEFFDAIRDFMDEAVVSIIAVTTASETENKQALPRFEQLQPIDAIMLFIRLQARRAAVVQARSLY